MVLIDWGVRKGRVSSLRRHVISGSGLCGALNEPENLRQQKESVGRAYLI